MEVRKTLAYLTASVLCACAYASTLDNADYRGYLNPNYVPPPTKGMVFAAISHMQPLVRIEKKLVDKAREYLREERQKLNGMKQFAEAVEKSMELSKHDPVKYLGNPINSYLIIKRFTSGWKELLGRLSVDDSKVKEMGSIMSEYKDNLPTYEDDLLGSIAALLRLMDTYGITATEIADGKIKGIKQSAYKLTASDLIEIVELSHNAKRYNRMMEFFYEVERIMTDKHLRYHRAGNLTMKSFHEFGGWCQYLNGDMKKALWHTKEVLKIDPTSHEGKTNLGIYGWYVDRNMPCERPECNYVKITQEMVNANPVYSRYNMACRADKMEPKHLRRHSSLTCFYKRDAPRLILKPVRVTRVHDNPEVLIFHKVVHQDQLDQLIRIATPEIAPAQVVDQETQEIKTASYRISKTMWLNHIPSTEKTKLTEKLNYISADLTDLDTQFSETYQIQNYGLGGQYEFHHDHGEPNSYLDNHPEGNRLATLLFYMSDVEKGGHTVFTKLGVTSYARKGDAILWHNLYKNGTGNPFTEHAGCPVIAGSKWVMNKWFKLRSGEKSKLCSLNRFE